MQQDDQAAQTIIRVQRNLSFVTFDNCENMLEALHGRLYITNDRRPREKFSISRYNLKDVSTGTDTGFFYPDP
jgi:hypothetical protein